MAVGIRIELNKGLYIRDPQATELGQNIIKYSILLIDEIGFEDFNFKLLAKRMVSTEASVYRYFENKNLLLKYLVSWYWEWVNYLIDINTRNIADPEEKLKIIIATFVNASEENPSIEYVNESVLHRLIITEGMKAYHSKQVDKENKEGFFVNYKGMVKKVSDVILEMNPKFPYPKALASNLFEMAINHRYFAEHLPRLTDVKIKDGNFDALVKMLETFTFNILKYKK